MEDQIKENEGNRKGKLRADLALLIQYVLDTGKQLDTTLIENISKFETSEDCPFDELLKLHNSLSVLIEPSNPTAVRFHMLGRGKKVLFFKDAPQVVKHTLVLTIVLILIFIGITTSESISQQVLDTELFARTRPQQFVTALLLLTSAGIGACFYNLSKMYGYIVSRTFDPKYVSSYWVRFVLGVIAGYILAEMIPPDVLMTEDAMQKPLLALLGGFSADVVDWALQRFVETLKTLIQGSQQHLINQQIETLKARLELEVEGRRLKAIQNIYAQRESLVSVGMDPKEVDTLLKKIVDGL